MMAELRLAGMKCFWDWSDGGFHCHVGWLRLMSKEI